jgi:hypothetical protein
MTVFNSIAVAFQRMAHVGAHAQVLGAVLKTGRNFWAGANPV